MTAIAHIETGSGRPLVLLHGIGSAAESWQGVLPRLAQGRRVLAWDAPGYGSSADLPTDWPSARDYAKALAGWLDGLGLQTCDVVGHSLGALMAAAFAADHPARVGKLVLASPAVGYGVAPGSILPAAVGDRLKDFDTLGGPAMAAKRAARLCAPGSDPAIVAAVERVMAKIRRPGYAQASAMLASGDLAADIKRTRCPMLIVCGSADVVTPPDRSRSLLQLRTGAIYQEIPNAGHALYIEAPDAFVATVSTFLETP